MACGTGMQFRKRAALVSQSECVRVRALNAATADRCVIHCSTARAIVQLGKRAGGAGRQLDGRVRADHPAPSTPCMCVLQESAHKAVMCERPLALRLGLRERRQRPRVSRTGFRRRCTQEAASRSQSRGRVPQSENSKQAGTRARIRRPISSKRRHWQTTVRSELRIGCGDP